MTGFKLRTSGVKKQMLYQLSHNYCPKIFSVCFIFVMNKMVLAVFKGAMRLLLWLNAQAKYFVTETSKSLSLSLSLSAIDSASKLTRSIFDGGVNSSRLLTAKMQRCKVVQMSRRPPPGQCRTWYTPLNSPIFVTTFWLAADSHVMLNQSDAK